MNEDFKNEVAKIIEEDVIKYLQLEIKSANRPEIETILEEYKKKQMNTQDVLYRLNEIKEYELARKLYNMIHVHQKNYHHIISIIGKTL